MNQTPDPIPYNRDAEIEAVEAKRKGLRSSDFYVALMAFDDQVAKLNKVRKQYEPNAEPLDPRELWIASKPKK